MVKRNGYLFLTMSQHHHPSDKEIRDRILSVKDKQYRMGYMYQYEIVGRISEMAGKYMPRNTDYRIYDVEGEEFVMFIAKTAKRKGRLRPCMRPLNTKYDPWAKQVLEYIQSEEEYPFLFHENIPTSKTYAMTNARNMFDGLYWPMIDYTRSTKVPYEQEWIKSERFNKKGYEEYLVIFPDGSRGWTTDPEHVSFGMKIESRWKPCTSHVIRKRSIMTLMNDYGIDGVSAGYIAGWTLGSQHDGTPPMLKTYMFMDLSDSEAAIPQLERQGRRYAHQLLVDYNLLI